MSETDAKPSTAPSDGRPFRDALTSLAFLLFLLYYWGVRYGDFLFACQENSFFVPRLEFFTRWAQEPDGALCWLSSFLLQFSYYPLLGAVIYATLLLGIHLLCAKLFGFKRLARALSFLPSCCVAVSITWIGFFLYTPYNIAINFAHPISLFATLLAFDRYRSIASKRVRYAFAMIFVVAVYPLAGFWAPFFALLCAIFEGTAANASRKKALAQAGFLVLWGILVPIIYYQRVYYARSLAVNIFTAGIIEDVRYDMTTWNALFSYGCALLAPLLTALFFAASRIFALRALAPVSSAKLTRKQTKERRLREKLERRAIEKLTKANSKQTLGKFKPKPEDIKREIENLQNQARVDAAKRETRLVWATTAIVCGATFLAAYHTTGFLQLLKMTRAATNAEWEKVLEIDDANPFPIDAMTQVRNVALYYTGRLAEDAFSRPVAGMGVLDVTDIDYTRSLNKERYYQLKIFLFNQRRLTENISVRAIVDELYCYWGQTGIGSRIAMNDLCAAEDRSVHDVKVLAFAALINGEDKLARRYLNILSDTFFHKEWARERLAYLDSPGFYDKVRDFHHDEAIAERIESERKSRKLAESIESAAEKYDVAPEKVLKLKATVEKIRDMKPFENAATLKAFPNLVFLAGIVKSEEFEAGSKERKELILVSLLLQKKVDEFLNYADEYLKLYPNGGAPRAIEEGYATWRFNRFGENWNNCDYKFSDDLVKRFTPFMDFMNLQLQQTTVSDPYVQTSIRDLCRGTYWAFGVDESVFHHY